MDMEDCRGGGTVNECHVMCTSGPGGGGGDPCTETVRPKAEKLHPPPPHSFRSPRMPLFAPSGPRFDSNKCKVHLRMLVNRFKLLEAKKANLNKQANRAVAAMLVEGKAESARIQVEHIIREDYVVEAYEILRQNAEIILARYNVVVAEHEPRREIQESLCTLIYAGWLLGSEVTELKVLLDQLTAKYGKPFVDEVTRHAPKYINPRVLHKLNHDIPSKELVDTYLVEIARAHRVDWQPAEPAQQLSLPRDVGGTVPAPLSVDELRGAAEDTSAGEPAAAAQARAAATPATDGPPAPLRPPDAVTFPGMDLTASWACSDAALAVEAAGNAHAAPGAAEQSRKILKDMGTEYAPPPPPYHGDVVATPRAPAADEWPTPSAPPLPAQGIGGPKVEPPTSSMASRSVVRTVEVQPLTGPAPAAADSCRLPDEDDEFLRRLASLKGA